MICKYESDNELRKLVENNLDNLNKIFYNEEDLECILSPVYIEITNESEEKLKEFEKEIEDIEGVKKLIFDFASLDYISSAGLRVLLSAQKVMTKQGGMIIRNVKPEIMEIFEVTGFSDTLTIE